MRIKLTNVIKGFIKAHPSLADDDVALIWAIWDWEMRNMNPRVTLTNLSARVLVTMWSNNQITSPSAISRARRKCQELYPETRGEVYEKRHNQQEQVKTDLQGIDKVSDKAPNGTHRPLIL